LPEPEKLVPRLRAGRHRAAERRKHGYRHAEGNRIFGATYGTQMTFGSAVFFTPRSQPGGGPHFLKRFRLRSKDRDPEVNEKVAPAQRAAIAKWGAKRTSLRLSEGQSNNRRWS